MKSYREKWHLKKGDAISFLDRGKVYTGRFYRWWDRYLWVHTETSSWRVIPHNVKSVRGESVKVVVSNTKRGEGMDNETL